MKTYRTVGLATLALILSASRPGAAAEFALDPAHTAIIFGISHMGFSYTYGRFDEMRGSFTLEDDPAACKFQMAIQAASIDTGNGNRDDHLRGADFLNAGEFPLITFESKSVAAKQDGDKTIYEVTGELTMHGVTKEITLPLVKLGEGEGPGGRDYRAGFHCDAKLMRSDFGMTNMIPGIGDEVAVTISFEGVRQ